VFCKEGGEVRKETVTSTEQFANILLDKKKKQCMKIVLKFVNKFDMINIEIQYTYFCFHI
jgi:hypothetical protein